jgi:hypothetical protein
MNPRDKALDLQHRMKDCLYSDGLFDAKQCALVCVEEISEVCKELPVGCIYEGTKDYYLKVKEELLKL